MDNIKNQIKNFKPFNEQEEKDKEYLLKFIDSFDDTLTRENIFGHFCASAFVLNKERTKILLVDHNIFKGYIFPGGHVDGEKDFLKVALEEVEEETGVKAKPINNEIFSLWTCAVSRHIKNGKFIPSHIHLDVNFLCEADESEKLTIKPDENKNVIWADINEIGKSIKLVDFFQLEYEKFLQKLKVLNEN
ncbi:MAG: NUDIX domain-containing protein [Clostridiales bacterium]|nr:NUDIX domain-containing protein [Clostridiales bacterium]